MKNKKNFILDEGKIRDCSSNISKMNLLEYIKLITTRNYEGDTKIKNAIKYSLEMIREGFHGFVSMFLGMFILLLQTVFLPVFIISCYYYNKRIALKEVNENKHN